jgi:MraZ protein
VLSLDQKGRLMVPARYKEVLMSTVQGRMVVSKCPDGCLALYPMPVYEKFEAEVLALPEIDAAWRRLYVGSATEVEIDSGSRVLIPPELRTWAGLEKEVKFMGVGAFFELWDIARYEAHEARTLAGERPEALRTLVIR